MNRIYNWLNAHPVVNVSILFIYFLAVVLPHKRFGTFLNNTVVGALGIDNNTSDGRQLYNLLALGIATALLIGVLYFFFNNSKEHTKRNRIWGYTIITTVLAGLVLKFLFVVNIEFVHYPQYALFAILAFPLIQNYHQTLIWTTIAGALDEAYQYFYLAPKDTSYYDMNDVITNLIGAVFGLLFIWSCKIDEERNPRFVRSSAFIGIVIIAITISVCCVTGILSIYPSDQTEYQLLREWPSEFWSTAHPNVIYHIILPLEGLIYVIVLWLFYSKIGKN